MIRDTAQQEAYALSRDESRLYKRLQAAKLLLLPEYQVIFRRAEFDFKNKRLLSRDGKFALQWFMKDPEGQRYLPEGVVYCLELEVAP